MAPTEKNPLPYPIFRSGRRSLIFAGLRNRGRQEFKEEGKPQVSLPFVPAADAAVSRAPQSATLR